MSAIGGVYSRSGAPTIPGFLDRLSVSLATMGSDGESRISTASVAMIYRPLLTDFDSASEIRTCVCSDGFVLAWDGRLDNRDELRHRYAGNSSFEGHLLRTVIALYTEFGVSGFSHLVGDFAFSLWDPVNEKLILACDALGRRPLYVLSTDHYVTWASRARALLYAWQKQPEPDEEYIADFLCNKPSRSSPYKSVQQVHGGEALVIHKDQSRLQTYWSLNPNASLRYSSDKEYEDHFRELFIECVRCRLPERAPVFCELSGGLDSSSIACVTAMISRLPRQVDRRLHTVSFVFNHASSSDEREFIEAAEGQLGARGLHLNEDDCPVLAPLPASLRPDCPTNVLLFFSRYDRVAREMHRQGARVLLNGIGGDQLFWSEPPAILPLADLLMRGHIASFFAESWTSSRTERLPYVKTLWWCLRSILFEGRVIEEDNDVDVTGTWLQPGFVSRNRLGERSHAMKDDLGFFLPSTTTQYSLWRQTMRTFALEPCPDNYYVDIRYPYLDRRLLEFALAIPLEQKVRPNQTRSVVRRSLSGIVPDAIRLRTSKGGPDEAFHRAAVREGDRLTREFTDLRLVTLGIVDPVRFAGALRRLRHGISENFMQLMRTLSLEFWLRSLEYPEHGSPSQAPASAAVTIPPKRAWSAAAAFSD